MRKVTVTELENWTRMAQQGHQLAQKMLSRIYSLAGIIYVLNEILGQPHAFATDKETTYADPPPWLKTAQVGDVVTDPEDEKKYLVLEVNRDNTCITGNIDLFEVTC